MTGCQCHLSAVTATIPVSVGCQCGQNSRQCHYIQEILSLIFCQISQERGKEVRSELMNCFYSLWHVSC